MEQDFLLICSEQEILLSNQITEAIFLKLTSLPYLRLHQPYPCFSSHLHERNLQLFLSSLMQYLLLQHAFLSAELKKKQLSYSSSLQLCIKAAVLQVDESSGVPEGHLGGRRLLLHVGCMNHPVRLPVTKYPPVQNQEESFSVEAMTCWGSAHGSRCRVCRQDSKT